MNQFYTPGSLDVGQIDELFNMLVPIRAQVDILATLAPTGGIDALKKESLCESLRDVEMRLEAVMKFVLDEAHRDPRTMEKAS